jgi:hypothetical protein
MKIIRSWCHHSLKNHQIDFVNMITQWNKNETMVVRCLICWLSWCGRLSSFMWIVLFETTWVTCGDNCWCWIWSCLFVDYDLLIVFGEDIIWWCKLYNIVLVICALLSLYLKFHAFIVMSSLLVKNVICGVYYINWWRT